MGSKFFDLHLADPAAIASRVRGDVPDLVADLAGRDNPPDPALHPVFDLMARGLFVFLAKGRERDDGSVYCRAVEHLLRTFGQRRWGIEFYPEEEQSAIWDLVFGRCEADWLDLPIAGTGIGIIGWRSPATCRTLSWRASAMRQEGTFNRRYISDDTLDEVIAALDEGSRSGLGLFAIYQA